MRQASSVNAGSSLRSPGANPWYGPGTLDGIEGKGSAKTENGKWFVPTAEGEEEVPWAQREKDVARMEESGDNSQLEEPELTEASDWKCHIRARQCKVLTYESTVGSSRFIHS